MRPLLTTRPQFTIVHQVCPSKVWVPTAVRSPEGKDAGAAGKVREVVARVVEDHDARVVGEVSPALAGQGVGQLTAVGKAQARARDAVPLVDCPLHLGETPARRERSPVVSALIVTVPGGCEVL